MSLVFWFPSCPEAVLRLVKAFKVSNAKSSVRFPVSEEKDKEGKRRDPFTACWERELTFEYCCVFGVVLYALETFFNHCR